MLWNLSCTLKSPFSLGLLTTLKLAFSRWRAYHFRMLHIGQRNTLQVDRLSSIGVFLIEEEEGVSLLLPRRDTPEGCAVGDILDVFVYRDSDDRLIATKEEPYVTAGNFANLKVVGTNNVGAFLDWGLPKDLLLPFREQSFRPNVGQRVMVYVYLDPVSERMVATTRIHRHLDQVPHEFKEGEEVSLMVAKHTDLGHTAIINGTHTGLIYGSEVPNGLAIGKTMPGYIGTVREDEKIDLLLKPPGYKRVENSRDFILFKLAEGGGFLPLNDKSKPEDIREELDMSKKTFKQVIGALYKDRIITIKADGIHLI